LNRNGLRVARLLRNGLEVLVPMAAGGAVFLAASAALGSTGLRELLDRRKTRRGRASAPPDAL